MQKRIWELDAARGLALIGMLIVHFVYDLTELTGVITWWEPEWFLLVKNNAGGIFLIISGICATLGSRNLRRGAQVFACGMICTAVTYAMYALGFADRSIVIWFGALHCLGVCMVVWSGFRHLPRAAVLLLGCAMVAVGIVISRYAFNVPWWLIPAGFCPEWFLSSDYFPLLPNLGYFLIGAWLGNVLYAKKSTLFPGKISNSVPTRILCTLGRKSLWVYLLHQPVLAAVAMAIGCLVR